MQYRAILTPNETAQARDPDTIVTLDRMEILFTIGGRARLTEHGGNPAGVPATPEGVIAGTLADLHLDGHMHVLISPVPAAEAAGSVPAGRHCRNRDPHDSHTYLYSSAQWYCPGTPLP